MSTQKHFAEKLLQIKALQINLQKPYAVSYTHLDVYKRQDMNRMLMPDVETLFLTCAPEYSTISSTIVRDVIRNNGDVSKIVPKEVKF